MLKLLKHELLSSYRPYLISLMVFMGVCLILSQFSSWIGIYEGLFSVGFIISTSAILSCYFVINFVHTNRIRKNLIASAIGIYFIGLFVSVKLYDLLPQIMTSWLWFSAVFEICLSVLFYCGTVYLIDHKLEME